MSKNLTQERLKELLSYDPATGVFVRVKRTKNQYGIGSIAGNSDASGYQRITIDGKNFKAHRLAWLYMTGAFPSEQIDHIDRNPGNNRFANLRAVTQSENQHNSGKRKDNNSGYKGVSYQMDAKKWAVRICINNVKIYLGIFHTPEEANAAYLKAERIYHPTAEAARLAWAAFEAAEEKPE
jgi:hypothetical protein